MPSDWSDDIPPYMLVGNPLGGYIDLGTDVPAIVSAYYIANYSAVTISSAWLGFFTSPTSYRYIITFTDTLNSWIAQGWVVGGVLNEISAESIGPGAPLPLIRWGNNTPIGHFFGQGATLSYAASPMGFGMARGGGFEQLTTTFTSTAVATEQLAYTSVETFTIDAGRWHEIEVMWQVSSTATQNPTINIRQNNLAGTLLGSNPKFALDVANENLQVYRKHIITNTTGVSKNYQVAITIAPSIATACTMQGAGIPFAAWLKVSDIGAGTVYGFGTTPVSVT